ncbi:maltose acetyltransferase domain-containing protein [Blastococcus brunescens]
MDDSRSMRERMLAGDLYIADDPEIGEQSAAALDLMAAYNATSARQGPLRRQLLEELLGAVGEGTEIRPPLFVDYGAHLRIGARCFANFGLVALDVAAITIGDDVQIGPNVQLLTPTHPVDPEPRRQKWRPRSRSPSGTTSGSAAARSCCPGSPSARTPWWAPARSSLAICPPTSSPSETRPAWCGPWTTERDGVAGAGPTEPAVRPGTAGPHRRHDPRRDRRTGCRRRLPPGDSPRRRRPLGSITYHFTSLDELLSAAFTAHVDTVAPRFDERMKAATGSGEVLEYLVEHLAGDLLDSARDLVLTVELYVAAARNPALRAVTQDWMARSRRSLERHFDPVTARELDALVEGLVLHSALSTDPMDRDQIRHALSRFAR